MPAADNVLHQPLGLPGARPRPAAPMLRSALPLAAVLLICGIGVLGWRFANATRQPEGVVALIKPAEPVPPPKPPPPAAPSKPDRGDIAVFRPSGTSAATGIFIKVPQDDATPAASSHEPHRVELKFK